MLDTYVEILKNGDIVAFPTETVYGLGADAWNYEAVKKVFAQKGRPADNPLIVHVSLPQMVENFAREITADARKLMNEFWPGPLTLIFSKKTDVLDIITGGLETVAIRWPAHPLSQELIALAGPLVGPSANSSGRPSPTKAEHVKEDFGQDFPVIKAGETDIGLESTVLDISTRPYQIYRPGAIDAKEIAEVVGSNVTYADLLESDQAAKSPGTKYSHYSPDADVLWLKNDNFSNHDALYLLHEGDQMPSAENVIHYQGDYQHMAHELYDRFREADHQGKKAVIIQHFSDKMRAEHPILRALENRISKALSH